jgi:hypothetical protein
MKDRYAETKAKRFGEVFDYQSKYTAHFLALTQGDTF